MKHHLLDLLARPGLRRVLRRAHRHQTAVVWYHGFTEKPHHEGIQNFEGLHLHSEMFRRHLTHLRDHYTVLPLQTYLEHRVFRVPLPPNSAVITLDDGYASNYSIAYPLLQEFKLPATIFITTDFVEEGKPQWTDRVEYAVDQADLASLVAVGLLRDGVADTMETRGHALVAAKSRLKKIRQEERHAAVEEIERSLGRSLLGSPEWPEIYRPLNWEQVREMQASGLIAIGSHTASHPILSRCSPEIVRQNLAEARRTIEECTGVSCPLFAYPNGEIGDFDDQTREVVMEVGHNSALTTVIGLNDDNTDLYELRRVGVLDHQSFEEFVLAITGVSRWSTKAGDALRRTGIRR